jgi:ABC-type Na+ efflux pump permease subunit
MKLFYKLVAQILIVCMVWTPFSLQAGMIGTDQVVSSAQDQANRDKVLNFVTRGDVVKQLETLGLSTSNAKERVAAMTQDEVSRVAGRIDSLPAGADSGAWILAVIVIGVLVWLIWYKK